VFATGVEEKIIENEVVRLSMDVVEALLTGEAVGVPGKTDTVAMGGVTESERMGEGEER